jgi:CD109 antigen
MLVAILVGSTLVVLNSDEIYLSKKNEATISVPDQLFSGGAGSLILQATDGNGDPVADRDVKVGLTRGGEYQKLWTGKTNDQGIAHPTFTVPYTVGEADLTIEVGSETFVTQVDVVSSYTIIVSTDKPLYQPGQTIHIRTLAFQGKNPEATDHDVLLEVKDPDGNKIFKKIITANDYGIASYDFVLSDQLPLGNYKIIASIEETSVEKTVSVQRYVLPKYKIQFEDINSWYVVTDTIQGTLNASYIFGEPIQGDVKIEARTYYGDWKSI